MNIFSVFAKAVKKQPLTIIILTLLLFAIAGQLAQQVKYEQGFKTYFSSSSEQYRKFELYSKDFGGSKESVYIFVKGDNVVNYQCYEYMLKLGKALSTIDGVVSVTSPASIIVGKIGYLPHDQRLIELYTAYYARALLPENGFAIIKLEVTTPSSTYNVIARNIERTIEFLPPPAGVSVEATGFPMVNYQVHKAIQGSLKVMSITAIFLMVILLISVFKGVVSQKRFLMMPLVISVFTAVMAFGVMPLVGIPLTDITNAFFPVLIGLSIEYAAQLQSRFEEELSKGLNAYEAAEKAIKSVGVALSLAMLTTVIGFLSMIFSEVPALSWFGEVSAIGLVIAYLLSLTFLPSVLVLFSSKKVEVKEAKTSKTLRNAAKFVSGRSGFILLLTALIIVGGFYGYSHVKIQTDYMKYYPQNLPAIRRLNELKRVVGSQDQIILVMDFDSINLKTLKKFDKLCSYIDSCEPDITSHSDFYQIVKAYGVSNDFQLYQMMSKMPESQKSRYVSGTELAGYFTVASMGWSKFKRLYDRINEEIHFFEPARYYLTGGAVLKMFISHLIISGQTKMTIASYVLVVILLLFVYRSFAKAVVPLLPITTVIAAVGGVMYLLGIERTIVSASLNSLTIGLGIDFSIHVMERYLEERRNGLKPGDAVSVTVGNTGRAIITSGLTMAGGFAAMMVSPFPVMQSFGFISVLAIIFSLIAALTIVPAFLVFVESFREL